VPNLCSIAVTRIGSPDASRRAAAKRVANGAIPASAFNGLPGETIHQTSSSASAPWAPALIRRWPRWAGLKEPPSSPVLIMGEA
jgi:hypothetical protein